MEKQTEVDLITEYFNGFSKHQTEQFTALGPLYREWNGKINVISRKDMDALYEKHVLHSLAIAAVANFKPGAQIVDIGTGGGFPGIPLAIFFPETEFLLVDSIGKKIKVVQEIAAAIELKNVSTIHGRVEAIEGRMFDFAVSRAVAPLADLWEWIQPMLRKGRASEEHANGLFCLKGGDLKDEIAASGLRPHLWPVDELFPQEAFAGKSVLYVPR